MGDNYLSTTETVLTAGVQAIAASALGTFLDSMAPELDAGKSDLQLGAEVLIQTGAGLFTLTEIMRALQPAADGYETPIGDGVPIYFFLNAQPNLRAKIADLSLRATNALQRALGANADEVETGEDRPTNVTMSDK